MIFLLNENSETDLSDKKLDQLFLWVIQGMFGNLKQKEILNYEIENS